MNRKERRERKGIRKEETKIEKTLRPLRTLRFRKKSDKSTTLPEAKA
jgi:hypothetical protein